MVEEAEHSSQGRSSLRLRAILDAQTRLVMKKIEVSGEDYLKNLPRNKKIIFATTHISDLDVMVASSVLSKYADIAITNMSIHHSFRGEPSTNIGIRIAGKHNFIPIDVTKDKRGIFNPENFAAMRRALESGKAIVIAAHNPSKDWKLSQGGVGAAYLASITKDAVVVPVTVDIQSDKPIGMYGQESKTLRSRPGAKVAVHAPIDMPAIDTTAAMITDSRTREVIRERSDKIMRTLASSLPVEKRGPYV